jgi:hexosaminidase
MITQSPPSLSISITDGRLFTANLGGSVVGDVLCFSAVVPIRAQSGCAKIDGLAGFTVLQVTSPEHFQFSFEDPDFYIANRAWLPNGAYLRHSDDSCTAITVHGPNDGAPLPVAVHSGPDMAGLPIVPQVREWQPANGILDVPNGFAATGAFSVTLQAANDLAQRNALTPLLGGTIPVHCIADDAKDSDKDTYRIVISQQAVTITARTKAGAFYGAMSLLQLQFFTDGHLPCGVITDSPRFEWRGQSLDCARHFYQTATITRLLDLMALFKLNRFHWHFSDDEAFRLHVPDLPELANTHFRGEDQLLPGLFGGGIGPTGGGYDDRDVATIVAHAAQLNIDVLPEIEFPAHATALNRLFADTVDPDDDSNDASVQGYRRNTINPAMPATWDLINRLVSAMADKFPFGHLHLGCDEMPAGAWSKSEPVQALMHQHELGAQDDVTSWMMDHIAKIARQHGLRPCAWEEAARGSNGGIGNGALLFSWSGQGPGLMAARQGYDVIMMPAQSVYFDMAYSDHFDDWGAIWAGACSLADTVNWDPVPADEPALEARIKGVQGGYWSEFTTKDAQLEPMLAPRILGLAETAWRPRHAKAGIDEIHAAARKFKRLFDHIGWNSRG